ncbi:MAG: diaminopimelate epimerase [Clostridiaceae bacterium]|uniref:Diaminopimelate epimerase n=1 Tax=Clostridium porci TaxID=2605778 RepID=A0A7X2TBY0_9CLOT|nr:MULTISPECIES: diaminopimelate epimerase [Clostridium]MCI6140238.1 diaminopimelate epimerase [Clostridium sp.]MDY3230356.1 diaminopimelate epimerase [Clostridiaceae bacterium]MSS36384.1 diaminopimelate epimerase [Clostridium porci]
MKFTKMQGIGNDYVYVNCFEETVREPGRVARFVSNRHFGIGSDGLILICPSDAADCRMEMYNADGSQGIMCGNGVRCVGKYVYDHGLVPGDRRQVTVETLGGIKTLDLEIQEGKVVSVTVDMGEAALTSGLPEDIQVNGQDYQFVGISVGNPHAVYFMEEIDSLDLERIGPGFELHERFCPERVNTEFIQVLDRRHLRMRVWERGSGETLACGTGAAASVMASILMGYVEDEVKVFLRGGSLRIRLDRATGHLFMTGPGVEVYSGAIDIPEEIYYD